MHRLEKNILHHAKQRKALRKLKESRKEDAISKIKIKDLLSIKHGESIILNDYYEIYSYYDTDFVCLIETETGEELYSILHDDKEFELHALY